MERNDLLNRQLGIAINHNSKDLVKNCENWNYIFHFRLFYQINHNSKDSVQGCENLRYIYIFFFKLLYHNLRTH